MGHLILFFFSAPTSEQVVKLKWIMFVVAAVNNFHKPKLLELAYQLLEL